MRFRPWHHYPNIFLAFSLNYEDRVLAVPQMVPHQNSMQQVSRRSRVGGPRRLGWKAGGNLTIDWRFAGGDRALADPGELPRPNSSMSSI